MNKITLKDQAKSILEEGEIISGNNYLNCSYVIVKAFGHTWRIDNPFSKNPLITQIERSENEKTE